MRWAHPQLVLSSQLGPKIRVSDVTKRSHAPLSSPAPYLWPLGKMSLLHSPPLPPPPPNPVAAGLPELLALQGGLSVLTFQTICSAKHSKERAVLSLRRTAFQGEPDPPNRRFLKAAEAPWKLLIQIVSRQGANGSPSVG